MHPHNGYLRLGEIGKEEWELLSLMTHGGFEAASLCRDDCFA